MAAVHAHDPNFHTICGIEECPRTYTNFYSFKKHLYRKHREVLNLVPSLQEQNVTINVDEDNEDDSLICEENGYDTQENDEMKHLALFILKVKTVHKLSQSALDGILDDVVLLLTRKVEYIQEGVEKITSNVPSECRESLTKLFQDPSLLTPFMGLETQYHQEKYIEVYSLESYCFQSFRLSWRLHVINNYIASLNSDLRDPKSHSLMGSKIHWSHYIYLSLAHNCRGSCHHTL